MLANYSRHCPNSNKNLAGSSVGSTKVSAFTLSDLDLGGVEVRGDEGREGGNRKVSDLDIGGEVGGDERGESGMGGDERGVWVCVRAGAWVDVGDKGVGSSEEVEASNTEVGVGVNSVGVGSAEKEGKVEGSVEEGCAGGGIWSVVGLGGTRNVAGGEAIGGIVDVVVGVAEVEVIIGEGLCTKVVRGVVGVEVVGVVGCVEVEGEGREAWEEDAEASDMLRRGLRGLIRYSGIE
jgi:hypothetical protein